MIGPSMFSGWLLNHSLFSEWQNEQGEEQRIIVLAEAELTIRRQPYERKKKNKQLLWLTSSLSGIVP